MEINNADIAPYGIGIAIGGGACLCLVLLFWWCPFRSCRSSQQRSTTHIEPLLVNGHVTVDTPYNGSVLEAPLAPPQYFNVLLLLVFGTSTAGLTGFCCWALVVYFDVIWKSGFVAALLLGGIAFVLRNAMLWFVRNVFLRRFYTTMQLSRENKESTPVLEWFKVWLPRYMKSRQKMFNNVSPLFRKKDGTTYFTMFQDTRRSDQFALSLWTMPGTHSFVYSSPKDGSWSWIVMHYYTKGEMKKTGWNNELVAQEYVDLYIFDPLHVYLRHLLEILEQAQASFGQKDVGALRFQRWNDWKEMWESRGADEPITANFRVLTFYEDRLLRRVYEEVEGFLSTPNDALLAAGMPLKLGFLLHGPPGTGKTHMVRHLAARYDLDIDIIDMNSGNMNNNALMHAVNMAAGILLFEDIDNVDAAIGVKQGLDKDSRKVTLDGLLNALDGVQRGASKRIIIATTNYPEKLVPSLRRRGRLGLSFEVTYPSDPVMAKLIAHNLPKCDVPSAVAGVRLIESRLGIKTATAALTDIFGKAGLRLKHPPKVPPMPVSGALPIHSQDEAQRENSEVALALQQVAEVLEEVSSTNKKVFRSIHELLQFLGLNECVTEGREDAKGHTWLKIGTERPTKGRDLTNEALRAALSEKSTFSEDEFKAFKLGSVRVDSYAQAADGTFWQPDPLEDCKPEERPMTYVAAFERQCCTDIKVCKGLADQQLKDEIGIKRLGHRLMLLEQFRFL